MNERIFISYSAKDLNIATSICEFLESEKFNCWMAPRDIEGGSSWPSAIIKGINECSSLILVFSSNSNSSRQVQQEVERAIDRNLRIITYRIEDISPSGSLELFLSSYQWIDAFEASSDSGLNQLLRDLRYLYKNTTSRNFEEFLHDPNVGSYQDHKFGEPILFNDSIREHMRTLNKVVEKLTNEQYSVIRQLHGVRRVRISGCAGSGKTLVAAEKAIRLSNAGLRTLFLCHNPLLASYVDSLTWGTGVEVCSFGEWVCILLGETGLYFEPPWTNYEEPDQNSLNRAFEIMVSSNRYDAVIVDEGQDFRIEWWSVVEAALDSIQGLLYIFHDDRQAILPYRSQYPITSPFYDLSKNCRNAGKIYEIIQAFNPTAGSIATDLKSLGEVFYVIYDDKSAVAAITEVVQRMCNDQRDLSLVALHAGISPIADSVLYKGTYFLDKHDWQGEVRRKFNYILKNLDTNFVKLPVGGSHKVSMTLGKLSNSNLPTDDDIKLITELASSFRIKSELRKRIMNDPRLRLKMTWTVKDNKVTLWKRGVFFVTPSEIILHFESNEWSMGIPEAKQISFAQQGDLSSENRIPTYRVSDFKGLESDAVLLNLQGPAPISREELYVGISRARMSLCILVDSRIINSLPLPIKSLIEGQKLRRSWYRS